MRLAEQGEKYKDSLEKKQLDSKTHDTSGNPLFTPAINAVSARIQRKQQLEQQQALSAPTAAGGVGGTGISVAKVSPEDALYQDAKAKEERTRLRNLKASQEIESIATASKMNQSSGLLLRKKAVSNLKI